MIAGSTIDVELVVGLHHGLDSTVDENLQTSPRISRVEVDRALENRGGEAHKVSAAETV